MPPSAARRSIVELLKADHLPGQRIGELLEPLGFDGWARAWTLRAPAPRASSASSPNLGGPPLRAGAYRLAITALDASGNRAGRDRRSFRIRS